MKLWRRGILESILFISAPIFAFKFPHLSFQGRNFATTARMSTSKSVGSTKIFVYGSLLSGLSNHATLQNAHAIFKCPCITIEKYCLTGWKDMRYPYMTDQPLSDQQISQSIVGELYEVSDETLPLLDELEEHPVYYLRTPMKVRSAISGDEMDCQAYFLCSEAIKAEIREKFSLSFFDVLGGDWKAAGGH